MLDSVPLHVLVCSPIHVSALRLSFSLLAFQVMLSKIHFSETLVAFFLIFAGPLLMRKSLSDNFSFCCVDLERS